MILSVDTGFPQASLYLRSQIVGFRERIYTHGYMPKVNKWAVLLCAE